MAGDPSVGAARLDDAVGELRSNGIERIHVLAWRDLSDPDAGGSEVHADELMRRWADRGLDIVHRTSEAAGLAPNEERHGYRVVRRGSRYSVFPRAVASELVGRMGPYDALVEIWNGVPWMSPVWCRRPHVTMFHHVHGPMWDQIFPPPFAAMGRWLETKFAPPFYRSGLTVTPSESTRDALLALGFRSDRVRAFPNGVDPKFSPGGAVSDHPSIVAVGRLAPVKRHNLVIAAALEARIRVPDLTLTIIGNGPLGDDLQRQIDTAGASSWITLAGRVSETELIDAYRRSWLVVSGSLAEGWGLSLTEGAACGTPSVATDIDGHRSSVPDGRSGVLVDESRLGQTIADVLLDDHRRSQLGAGALEWANRLTWDSSALGLTRALCDEVRRAGGR